MKRIKNQAYVCVILLAAVLLTACNSTKGTGSSIFSDGATGLLGDTVEGTTEKTEDTKEPSQLAETLYAVIGANTAGSTLRLYNTTKDRQEDYTYNDGTRFLDKYGDNTSLSQLVPGRIIQLETYRKTGELRTVQISDGAWEYDGVKRFSVDTEESIFEIAGTKYYYEDDLHVFSGEDMISIEDLEEQNTLRVQGIGRKILTISVTSGCGTIHLTNTELFEGGWLSLSSKQYYKVTKDMQLEVPEGAYLLSVANDGYGDTKEITVKRGEETVVNLDELKGEGPKFCTVTFQVGVENAVMTVDGKKIDYTKPQKIKYGIHRLEIIAEGYETWSRRLYVNSKEATIEVAMTSDRAGSGGSSATEETKDPEDKKTSGSTEKNSGNSGKAGSMAGSMAGSQAGSMAGSQAGSNGSSASAEKDTGNKNTDKQTSTDKDSTEKSTEKSDKDELDDYMKKLSDIIDTLTGSSSDSD